MEKIIILDRDGVINHDSADYIKSPKEWNPIPGSLAAIAKLTRSGFHVVIATNQAGIERRLFTMDVLNSIHNKMHQSIKMAGGAIQAIFFCPCLDGSNCECRKPKPGMLLDISRRFNVTPKGIPFIGDSVGDLLAAEEAGCQPILVLTGNGEKTKNSPNIPSNTLIFNDLESAVDKIIDS